MPKTYTTRFQAFAASRGVSPEAAPANYEFINWVNRHWREFRAERGLGNEALTDTIQFEFDDWLTSRYGVPA